MAQSQSNDPFASIAQHDPFAAIAQADQQTSAPHAPIPHALIGTASDTLSNVGTHLANLVRGPYHAFTDAPQNPEEQKIASLPGNASSGLLRRLDLGAYRMLAEPSVEALKTAGQQYKAGNYGLGAKDTTYDDQGNYKPTVLSSAMDAVPMAGPWARQVETEAHQKGLAPALAGLATDALAPREIAKVGGLGLRGAGKVAQAASATPESLHLYGTRALTNGTPGELLQSALKPGARYGANVADTLHESLPYALKADPNLQGVSGFARASDAARNAQFGQYDDLIAPYRKLQPGMEGPVRPGDIHGGPIAKAQMLSIPPMDLIEDNPTAGRLRRFEVPDPEGGTLKMGAQEEPRGGIVQRTKDLGEKYNRPMSIPLMDAVREDANAKLNSFYNKSGGDQAAALSNPETARVKAVGDTSRQLLYPELESNAGLPSGTVAKMQSTYGKLADTADIANKREPIYARHDPVTLGQKVAVAHGGPVATAFNFIKEKALNNLTNSDALVNSAVDRFQNPTGTPLQPRSGLLPRATSQLGRGAEATGKVVGKFGRRLVAPPVESPSLRRLVAPPVESPSLRRRRPQ